MSKEKDNTKQAIEILRGVIDMLQKPGVEVFRHQLQMEIGVVEGIIQDNHPHIQHQPDGHYDVEIKFNFYAPEMDKRTSTP